MFLKKHHNMQLPRQVIIGNKTIDLIPKISKNLGFKKSALIISGHKTYDIAGEKVKTLLKKEKFEVNSFLVNSATVEDLNLVEKQIEVLKPQVVFGVGGGTKIDVAKLSSARKEIPFISVPTTASHDGISSPLSSIKGLQNPYSVMAQAPLAIIADTNIIIKAPWRFTVSGCADIISKYTAVKDWQLAHKEKKEYYGEYAASLALMSWKLVTANNKLIAKKKDNGLRVIIEALISCGVAMSIAGSSRPCSGSEHLFSHALDIVKPNKALHGEKCGVGTIIMAYMHNANWKGIKLKLEKIGSPINHFDLGVEREDIIKALEIAAKIRPERYNILSKLNLNRQDYKKITKITGVT